MERYDYVIVGGGVAADAAVRGIRKLDDTGSLVMVSAEPDPPYDRPPLSKALWKKDGDSSLADVDRGTTKRNVELVLGRRVVALDVESKRVTDDAGSIYEFDKLLLATGGEPIRLDAATDRIVYFRTLEDYRRVKSEADAGSRFVVIGGGFIGTEMAAALRWQDREVTMLLQEAGLGGGRFPEDLASFLVEYYREHGVDVRPGTSVSRIYEKGDEVVVETSSGESISTDFVVAGIGVRPAIDLARTAGLSVDEGIVVDEMLRTDHRDIYAAGDVARFANATLDRQLRVEHEDNAIMMGRIAGRNMAGAADVYDHLPFFYSDLFDLGYEAVGICDPRLEVVTDWKDPFREGIVYYVEDGRVRGVLLWNVWGRVGDARKLIAEPGPFVPEDLKGW